MTLAFRCPECYAPGKVKRVLLLPVVFLFAFLCAAVAFSALCFLASWGGSWDGQGKPTAELAVRGMPSTLLDVLFPSVLVGLLAVGMRSTRKPVNRIALFLIALALSSAVTAGGFLGLQVLRQGIAAAAPPASRPLAERSFARIDASFLSAEKVDGAALRGVLLYSPDAKGARFRVFAAATAERSGDLVRVMAGKPETAVAEGNAEGAAEGIFRADPMVRAFLSDLTVLRDDLLRLRSASLPEFLTAVFSLLFALTASFAFLRISRWPLANLFLYVLAARGALLLFRLLREGLGAGIAAAFSDPVVARLLPYGIFTAAGLLLLLVDLLFVPANRLQEGF